MSDDIPGGDGRELEPPADRLSAHDANLLRLIRDCTSVEEIAAQLGRPTSEVQATLGALALKLRRLGGDRLG